MRPNLTVLCTQWGSKYDASYVNRLQAMVGRHLHQPHRFVCLTEDPEGLKPEVEALPFPDTGVAALDRKAAWTREHGWLKTSVLAAPLHDITGTVLCLDLDIVIVDALDPFLEVSGEFVAIREWDKSDGTGNTSVFRFRAGAHDDLLDPLRSDPVQARAGVRNEQEYITLQLARQGRLSYWPGDWVRSFKRHCTRPFPLSLWQPPRIPPGTRIIAFHGRPNPPDAMEGRSGRWYRRIRPTPWIRKHWR
ncbi:MAG: glycosyltransferase [Gemmatimonadales bacterium]|nr:MAG: glycosyltransferase [Gemmatimonadales bacterium]